MVINVLQLLCGACTMSAGKPKSCTAGFVATIRGKHANKLAVFAEVLCDAFHRRNAQAGEDSFVASLARI